MLDGLERTDRATELDPALRVLDRALEAALGSPDLLCRQRDCRQLQGLGETGCGATVGAEQGRRCVLEGQLRLLAGLVHGGQRGSGEPWGIAFDGEEAQAGVSTCGDQDQVGHVTVEDVALRPIEDPSITALGRRELDGLEVPPARGLGDGQRRDRLTSGDAGEVRCLRLVVATGQQRVGGQRHRREVRRAQQRCAHLLEDHDQLDVGEAGAAELLWDDECLEAKLLGHLRPHRRVVAVLGGHEGPDLGLRRLLGQEAVDHPAELVLLLVEGEVHLETLSVTSVRARTVRLDPASVLLRAGPVGPADAVRQVLPRCGILSGC